MGQGNAVRVEMPEGAYVFVGRTLDKTVLEMQRYIAGADVFIKIIRSNGLISRTEYYTDPNFVSGSLILVRQFTRVSGSSSILLVSGIYDTYYEFDGSTIDSHVSGYLYRDFLVSGVAQDGITSASGFFGTDEDVCL